MNKSIPVVIVHTQYKDYLKVNLEITSKNNTIFLIGDTSLKHLESIDNVKFIDINKYRQQSNIEYYKTHFVNYSSNPSNYEWQCYERVFILKYFMNEYNFSRVFHMDSDNVLLIDINTFPFTKEIAYCISKNYHQYRMSNSIHVGLLNDFFCDKFIELYCDIYIHKTKYHLIEDKIKYHTINNKIQNGGICDMTLYYILQNEKLIDVQNLLDVTHNKVFMNNINNPEGFDYKQQYKMKNNYMCLHFVEKNITINDIVNNKFYSLMNIHFQGSAKNLLTDNFKNTILKYI